MPLARIDHPVRYYLIDCHRFLPNHPHLVLNWGDRDPELRERQLHDLFKVDVFTVGNIFFSNSLPGSCALIGVAHPSDQTLLEIPWINPSISCRPYRIHDESRPRSTAQCGEGTSEMAKNQG